MSVTSRIPGRRHRARSAEDEIAKLRAEVAVLRQQLDVERYAARHDPLTGLPNRRAFHSGAQQLVATSTRAGPITAMMLDLTDFKQINDAYGHRAGDQMLIYVAARLAAHVSDAWLVARLGGDEFAGLRAGPADQESLSAEADALVAALAAPVVVGHREVQVRVAIGLVQDNTSASLSDLLHRADIALYQSKRAGHPVLMSALTVTPSAG